MAWIESHQEIAQHPKTRRLARYLGVSLPDAIGRLHLLWWWSTTYATDGDLSSFDAADLADATLWEGDAETLMDALKRSGFIDDNEQIHDWHEYAGRLLERRRQDAERKRISRAPSIDKPDTRMVSSGRPADVHSPSGVTVPNPTVPDSTGPEDVNLPADLEAEGAAAPPAAAPEDLDVVNQTLTGQPGWSPTPAQLVKLSEIARSRGLDLETEALKIADWLKSPKGKGRQCTFRFFANWLEPKQNDPPPKAVHRNGSARASPILSPLQTLGADEAYLKRDWNAELGGG